MVLKLYGAPASPYVRLVAAVLLEKQVPFELVLVDLSKGEHKTPEYLSNHPYGQVPYIDDDGFVLYESKAISHYIASKYADQGTPLLPTGLKANALYQQAVFAQISHFEEHGRKAVVEIFSKRQVSSTYKPGRRQGLTPDNDVVEKHIADLTAKLDVYDKILSKQKYLVGDEITLVDIYHVPLIHALAKLGFNVVESKPNVARWYNDASSRPSWQAVKDGDIKSIY